MKFPFFSAISCHTNKAIRCVYLPICPRHVVNAAVIKVIYYKLWGVKRDLIL